MKALFGLILTFALSATTNATDQSNPDNSTTMSNKEKAIALLNSIQSGDQAAIGYVNAEEYTQHNLSVGDGLAGFGAALQALPEGSARVNVVRSFEDGNYVFTHTDYNFFGPKSGFDVFRFENGLIVEHWDNLIEQAAPNPSGHTQFDGATTIVDLSQTNTNKMLVQSFVQTILADGDMDKIGDFITGDNYIQHNPGIADGLSGLGHALETMAKEGITMVYSKVHKVLGEGNFVLVISEGKFADQPTSFYDLFRVENGKIVEHWDVMETIIPKDQWKNNNGKFGGL